MSRRLIAAMFGLGFVSGLPLYLSGFTFRQWLTDGGATPQTIGLMANLGLPYTLKFLWAPALDQVRPPGSFRRLGRRRGWMAMAQLPLALAILALAGCRPAAAPLAAIVAAATVAFCSASQDVAIDAWRIESFPPARQGLANAIYIWGYRVGMLAASTGVLAAAAMFGWPVAWSAAAALAAASLAVTWLAPEPPGPPLQNNPGPNNPGPNNPGPNNPGPAERGPTLLPRLGRALIDSAGEFLRRPGSALVLGFVALFNLGEAMAGVMLTPFYRDLGFTKTDLAGNGPVVLLATMAGIGVGGVLVARFGLARALIATGFFQMAVMAAYVGLAHAPGSHAALYGTVAIEAFAQGLATSAFVAYLSSLCSPLYTATQFALLTSLAPLGANLLGGLSGFLAARVGWSTFFSIAMLCALPAMGLMLVILRRPGSPPSDAGIQREARLPG